MIQDFSWLLAPVGKETFVQEHWARAPLRIGRADPGYYAHLLAEEDLEFLLQSASRVQKGLEILVEGDRSLRPQSYSHAVTAFRNGRSLRVDSIQRFSRPIMTLARSLELAIGCPVNVNLYLTPGAGKKALSRHYDTHDVFVLQIFGRKIWHLYDSPQVAPLEHLPLQRRETLREMRDQRLRNSQAGRDDVLLTEELTLAPGDMLYLPRGFWHEAESEVGKVSCHLTVGVQPTTYLDLMTMAISGAADAVPLLRASLPYGFTVDQNAGSVIGETMKRILEELPHTLDVPKSVQQVASVFLRSYRTGLENNLLGPVGVEPAQHVEANTVLRVGAGVVFGINASTQPAQFVWGSKTFEIAGAYEEACRFLATAAEFTAANLPGDLPVEARLALCRQLLTEGVLVTTARTGEPPTAPAETPTWIPTRVDPRKRRISWIDLGSRVLSEPFFQQTVKNYLETSPNAPTRVTPLRAAMKVSEQAPPSGFIFHVSRCGSTLLANSLKYLDGSNVVSEPQPVSGMLSLLTSGRSPEEDRRAKELLAGVVRAYGQRRAATERHFVLKFSSWNLVHLQAIRELWPGTPVAILVRNPLEVAVSCMEEPTGWMRWREGDGNAARDAFGWSRDEVAAMSADAYCARVLGEFLAAATRGQQDGASVFNYPHLTPGLVEQIAKLFGMSVTAASSEAIAANFSLYSKDPRQSEKFEDDSALKQRKASPELRAEIDRWARPRYDDLLAAQRH